MKIIAVSILIPVNSEKYLSETLKSIQDQDIDHNLIEVILISDRVSLQKIEKIARDTLHGIDFQIHESNLPGIVPALNLGIKKTEGEFVARLDHDDLMIPNRLSLQFKFLSSNLNFSAVGGQICLINMRGEYLGKSFYPTTPRKCRKSMRYTTPLPHPGVMFRKKDVVIAGGYRLGVPEDWDLWARLSEFSEITNLKETVIYYRIHANQLSRVPMYKMENARKSLITSGRLRNIGLLDLPQNNITPKDWYSDYMANRRFGTILRFVDSSRWLLWDFSRKILRIITTINPFEA